MKISCSDSLIIIKAAFYRLLISWQKNLIIRYSLQLNNFGAGYFIPDG